MFIDTHCHLTHRYVPADEVSGVIHRARDAGVGALVMSGAAVGDAADAVALCEKYDNLFCTVGIHPEYAISPSLRGSGEQGEPRGSSPSRLRRQPPSKGGGTGTVLDYTKFLSHPKVVGVGEIGLDFYYDKEIEIHNKQIEFFRAQLKIAADAGLPVAIHSRAARAETVEILCDAAYANLGGGLVPGVMHFHCMPWEFTKKLLDRGFYFSATGIITFKNADAERDVFARIPIDRIVIETDAPWCAPVPFRGKTCEPAMVVETARALAEIHSISLPELENILFENTKRLYPKMII